jgi:hypothetical protein
MHALFAALVQWNVRENYVSQSSLQARVTYDDAQHLPGAELVGEAHDGRRRRLSRAGPLRTSRGSGKGATFAVWADVQLTLRAVKTRRQWRCVTVLDEFSAVEGASCTLQFVRRKQSQAWLTS